MPAIHGPVSGESASLPELLAISLAVRCACVMWDDELGLNVVLTMRMPQRTHCCERSGEI
eukprot:33452-Eustigmatos_ZCMA.PRE.1